MSALHSIGVVLPTLNCAGLLPEHIDSMQSWLDLVSEIVVVDSHSTDGTVELIRGRLKHLEVCVHLVPRGLYQSWNFGLAQLRTRFAYISTVGDSITREGLLHLLALAERLACDVVISKPHFVDNDGRQLADMAWPIDDITNTLHLRQPASLEGMKLFLFTLLNVSGAILGSSSSNLYRTDCLKRHPFPTDFGTSGDAAWGIANVFDYSLCVTPERFSTFRLHPKSYSLGDYAVVNLNRRLFELARDTLTRRCAVDAELRVAAARWCSDEFLQLVLEHLEWQHRLESERRRKVPWIFNSAAWRARIMRGRFSRLMHERKRAVMESLRLD